MAQLADRYTLTLVDRDLSVDPFSPEAAQPHPTSTAAITASADEDAGERAYSGEGGLVARLALDGQGRPELVVGSLIWPGRGDVITRSAVVIHAL